MNSEDNNEEILQFKSYEININNPISINKKSEKEKKINPEIIENDKKLRNLISNKELTKEIKNNEEEISKKMKILKIIKIMKKRMIKRMKI